MSWTCHRRIHNRRRDLLLYTVGRRALSHRISTRSEERGERIDSRIGDDEDDEDDEE